MTMSIIWTGMVVLSLAFGLATDRLNEVAAAATAGAASAVDLCFSMAGVMCLWSGVMEVMDYYGSYYSTTFRYPVQTGADSIAGAASENVERYLDRKLTDAEREELRTAVQSVVMGAGILQIQALSEYVRVSVFSEDGSIHIQCS